MFWIRIIITLAVVLSLFLLWDLIKLYKKRNYVVRCNKCGSTDTVLKNNDTKEKFFSYDYHVQKSMTYTARNPQTFFCNQCRQEYSLKEGTFVRKQKEK